MTIRDAKQSVRGLGGALVRALPGGVGTEFSTKAEELGRQIAADNGVVFERDGVSEDTPLSNEALGLLEDLESFKRSRLLQRA